ncbi:LysR family transcriptional regulator [Actinosynnema sp. NPDC020468]|uniref:LysR family transcriptional regulator n=1 Tax=Actinosynnema sp. NPDC020468 TaxID=3154488 RepID=UPI0033EE8BEA
MNLEVRHLRFVDAIDRAGSLTRAAAELGLSQPALSAQLRRIEQVVGGPLFVRGRHGATPTPLGGQFLVHARAVLAGLDAVRRQVEAFHDRSPLRIGVPPCVPVDVVGDAVPGAARPVVVGDRSAALRALVAGGVDLVSFVDFSGRECVVPPRVVLVEVGVEPYFVRTPDGSGRAGLADLVGHTWLLSGCDGGFGRHLVDVCAAHGIRAPVVRVPERSTAALLLRRGERVVVPVRALSGDALPGVVVDLPGTPLRARHLVLGKDSLPRHRVLAVRDGLRAAYRARWPTCPVPGWFERNPGWLGAG